MMARDDGGPAFPSMATTEELTDGGYRTRQYLQPGMTLRDWFAGQALANSQICESSADNNLNASWAYDAADAMLKERAK